jgi:imidazolonepropionase-like amidohydrolase
VSTNLLRLGALSVVLLASAAQADEKPAITAVRATRLLDPKSGRVLRDAVVLIEGDRIQAAGADVRVPAGAKVIDLGDATLLPGLIDCHTHLVARFPDGPQAYARTLVSKSQAFRALEGAANARATLLAGYTSVRDVDSEGAGYADVALRDAIGEGLVEGPRMMVATRAIAAVGDYHPFRISPDLERFPTGAQMISGPEEARRAAREQLGHGADLLKIYADWDTPTLTVEEMRVVVEEAHRRGKKVAAHATTTEGIRNAITSGVDSIEHGDNLDRALLLLMRQKNVYWVPTLGVVVGYLEKPDLSAEARARFKETLEKGRRVVSLAREVGVQIAAGFDPAEADTHGHNARELVELVRLGLPPLEAVRSGTIIAAELLGRAKEIGSLEKGAFGDLVAVLGNPLADISQLERVSFVMKGGVVIKLSSP